MTTGPSEPEAPTPPTDADSVGGVVLAEDETWKDIPGYEGMYAVSDQGRVKSLDRYTSGPRPRFARGRTLKPHATPTGYLTVDLSKEGSHYPRKIHQLVLLAFVGPCPEGMEVCHANGVRTDNRLSNLRYGTRSENMLDRVQHGNHPNASKDRCPKGHPYDYVYPASGSRGCLTCIRARGRINYQKRKAARNED